MIKTLTKHGNSWAVIIDKPILDLLNIAPETPLEITTDGHSLMIFPAVAGTERAERIRAASEKAHQKFGKAFEKLAE